MTRISLSVLLSLALTAPAMADELPVLPLKEADQKINTAFPYVEYDLTPQTVEESGHVSISQCERYPEYREYVDKWKSLTGYDNWSRAKNYMEIYLFLATANVLKTRDCSCDAKIISTEPVPDIYQELFGGYAPEPHYTTLFRERADEQLEAIKTVCGAYWWEDPDKTPEEREEEFLDLKGND